MKCVYLPMILLPLLAGCGGGSSSQFSKSFEGIQSTRAEILDDTIDAFNADGYTDLSTLPTSGSASFEGTIGLGDVGTAVSAPVLVGEMEADINLRTNDVSGTAGNFFATFNEEPLSGTLDLNATLDRDVDLTTDFGITGTLDGRVGVNGESFDIDLDITADLVGDDADFLGGSGIGTLDDLPLEGSFILENTD